MFDLQDVHNIEGEAETEEDYFVSLQHAINSCEAWKLQGSYGRAMSDAIASGRCMLGLNDCHDYWGNHVPSRVQVEDGTKGSRSFVAKHHGNDWAAMIEDVE